MASRIAASRRGVGKYSTTVDSCNCPDHKYRHKVCKHMRAVKEGIPLLALIEGVSNGVDPAVGHSVESGGGSGSQSIPQEDVGGGDVKDETDNREHQGNMGGGKQDATEQAGSTEEYYRADAEQWGG